MTAWVKERFNAASILISKQPKDRDPRGAAFTPLDVRRLQGDGTIERCLRSLTSSGPAEAGYPFSVCRNSATFVGNFVGRLVDGSEGFQVVALTKLPTKVAPGSALNTYEAGPRS